MFLVEWTAAGIRYLLVWISSFPSTCLILFTVFGRGLKVRQYTLYMLITWWSSLRLFRCRRVSKVRDSLLRIPCWSSHGYIPREQRPRISEESSRISYSMLIYCCHASCSGLVAIFVSISVSVFTVTVAFASVGFVRVCCFVLLWKFHRHSFCIEKLIKGLEWGSRCSLTTHTTSISLILSELLHGKTSY